MTQQVYPNSIVTVKASIQSDRASLLANELKLDRVELMLNDKPVKTLDARSEASAWIANTVFTATDAPGDYRVHWKFSINGQNIDRYDQVTLLDPLKVEISTSVNETWEECQEKSRTYIKKHKPHLKGKDLDKEVDRLCGFIRQKGLNSSPIEDPETVPSEILAQMQEVI